MEDIFFKRTYLFICFFTIIKCTDNLTILKENNENLNKKENPNTFNQNQEFLNENDFFDKNSKYRSKKTNKKVKKQNNLLNVFVNNPNEDLSNSISTSLLKENETGNLKNNYNSIIKENSPSNIESLSNSERRNSIIKIANTGSKIKNKIFLSFLVFFYVLFGLCNNVGVQMMGYKMAPYPEFLLYGSTLIYTLLFGIIGLINKENFLLNDRENRKALHKQFLWLGLWTSINGVLSQFAIPFVEPELTSLLTQVALPVTWISSWYMFRFDINLLKIICGVVIIAGLGVGLVGSYINGTSGQDVIKNSGIFWIICTILSAIPTAFETTYQEWAFKKMNSPKWVTLTYYNFYSLITYVVTMPLTMTNRFKVSGYDSGFTWNQMWSHQWDAIKCFFGDHSVNGCEKGATFWTMVFSLGYVGFFGVGAYLIENIDSSIIANLNALLVPLTTVIFWLRPIVGEYVAGVEWYIGASVFIILIGDVLFETSKYLDAQKGKLSKFLSKSIIKKRK